eukprot:TRINITY_DN51090_c0_g1_i1.p1 TRINITY_DN51090_c0_g1~~TRINITY_DN51090_c0_g1_i1.p1  ORF type:complete len:1345 (-),score=280.63 TRINITY_DN51090_c0_g1_i1:44-4078(-)
MLPGRPAYAPAFSLIQSQPWEVYEAAPAGAAVDEDSLESLFGNIVDARQLRPPGQSQAGDAEDIQCTPLLRGIANPEAAFSFARQILAAGESNDSKYVVVEDVWPKPSEAPRNGTQVAQERLLADPLDEFLSPCTAPEPAEVVRQQNAQRAAADPLDALLSPCTAPEAAEASENNAFRDGAAALVGTTQDHRLLSQELSQLIAEGVAVETAAAAERLAEESRAKRRKSVDSVPDMHLSPCTAPDSLEQIVMQLPPQHCSASSSSSAAAPCDAAALLKGAASRLAAEEAARVFAWPKLRKFQQRVIEAWASGKNSFVLSGTGSGKSGCFLLPALVARRWHEQLGAAGPPPVAVVVSPLVALMRDQVQRLQSLGVPAVVRSPQCDDPSAWHRCITGQVAVCYMSPELIHRLATSGQLARLPNVSLLAVDEAHCVSEWGHDFRPEYGQLSEVIAALITAAAEGRRTLPPVIALTATCTLDVRADVVRSLGFDAERTAFVLGTMNRPNLYFAVEEHPKREQMEERLVELFGASLAAPERRREELIDGSSVAHVAPAVVYARRKADCVHLAQFLESRGVKAAAFHSGFENDTKQHVQDSFQRNDIQVVIATIAFGMGIDKPDVRRVIHYGLPASLEAYAQESGRAGRDGNRAECIVLYSASDRIRRERCIGREEKPADAQRKVRRLHHAFQWCRNAVKCRRAYLLEHLGENASAPCGLANSQARPQGNTLGFCSMQDSERGPLLRCSHCDVCCQILPHCLRDVRRELLVLLACSEQLRCGRQELVVKAQEHAASASAASGLLLSKEGWIRIVDAAVDSGLLDLQVVFRNNCACVVPIISCKGRQYLRPPDLLVNAAYCSRNAFLVDLGPTGFLEGEEQPPIPLTDCFDRFALLSDRQTTSASSTREGGTSRETSGEAAMLPLQPQVGKQPVSASPEDAATPLRRRCLRPQLSNSSAPGKENDDAAAQVNGAQSRPAGSDNKRRGPNVPGILVVADESDADAERQSRLLEGASRKLEMASDVTPASLEEVKLEIARELETLKDAATARQVLAAIRTLVHQQGCSRWSRAADSEAAQQATVLPLPAPVVPAGKQGAGGSAFAAARFSACSSSGAASSSSRWLPPAPVTPSRYKRQRLGKPALRTMGAAASTLGAAGSACEARQHETALVAQPVATPLASVESPPPKRPVAAPHPPGNETGGGTAAVVVEDDSQERPAAGESSQPASSLPSVSSQQQTQLSRRPQDGALVLCRPAAMQKMKRANSRRYTEVDRSAASPLASKIMELINVETNRRGGAMEFKKLMAEARALATSEQQVKLDDVSKSFVAKSAGVHRQLLETLLEAWWGAPVVG